jgi:hypothetical protein
MFLLNVTLPPDISAAKTHNGDTPHCQDLQKDTFPNYQREVHFCNATKLSYRSGSQEGCFMMMVMGC